MYKEYSENKKPRKQKEIFLQKVEFFCLHSDL